MIPLLLLAAIDLVEVRATAVDFLLDRQENNIEWPYRGVYRAVSYTHLTLPTILLV